MKEALSHAAVSSVCTAAQEGSEAIDEFGDRAGVTLEFTSARVSRSSASRMVVDLLNLSAAILRLQ
jgi:hypothetical protein